MYSITPGTAFSLNVTVFDMDAQAISILGNGEPFLLTSNQAQLAVTNGVGSASAILSWTPSAAQERTAPYIMGLRISEIYSNYVFQSDISISLRVGFGTTGIVENALSSAISVSPNPSTGNFAIQFNSTSNSPVKVDITSIDGKVAQGFTKDQIVSGLNVIQVNNLNLAKGAYIVRVEQDGKYLGMQRLIIQH
ncbi:MAG: T9SS type A sorting domain-containing protein [Bacteroidetes bacterium]|nr:T9SS type A sorting domain-containing protein [Bacteroidota bacterium]